MTVVDCLTDLLAGHPLSPSFLCLFLPTPDYRSAMQRASPESPSKNQKVSLAPQPPKMDLLTVPMVDTQMEARPMTLEEMEDVGKRYRERKRQHKVPPLGEGTGLGDQQVGFRSTPARTPAGRAPGSRLLTAGFPHPSPLTCIIRTIPSLQGFCKDEMR